MNTYAGDAGCGGSCLILCIIGLSILVSTGYGIYKILACIF